MAEKLEMSKYFVEQSTRNMSFRSSQGGHQSPPGSASSSFRSSDLTQSEFYRRVGHDPESEERRQRWQYRNMMDGFGGGQRGMGASPRYGYR